MTLRVILLEAKVIGLVTLLIIFILFDSLSLNLFFNVFALEMIGKYQKLCSWKDRYFSGKIKLKKSKQKVRDAI